VYLHVIAPNGTYTCIDLVTLPVWRLELGAKAIGAGAASHIALMLAYVAPTGPQRVVIAAVDTKSADDAPAIADVGFPNGTKDGDRARLHEAAKSLHNVESLRKEADGIAQRVALLADLYHGFLDALVEVRGGALDTPLGPPLKGTIEGWRFALTAARFESWRDAADQIAMPVESAKEDRAAAPPSAPPPPAAPVPRRPSREQLRKATAPAPATTEPLPEPVEPPTRDAGEERF